MSTSKITAFALTALIAFGVAPGGMAQDLTPEQAVEARKAAMRSNAQTMSSAGELSGADAVAAADTLIKNFTDLPNLFPENSTVEGSRALPLIWENFEEFTGLLAAQLENATALKAAAEAGNAEAYAATLATIGGVCGQCHEKFRAPNPS